MVFIALAALCFVGLWALCAYSLWASLSKKTCRICAALHAALGLLGIAAAVASVLIFAVLSKNIDPAPVGEVIRDSAYMYFTTAGAFFLAGFGVTLACSLLKVKLRSAVPVAACAWCLPLLFWTYMCAVWSDFSELSASPFVIVYGIALCAVMLLSSLPLLLERARLLASAENVRSIKAKRAAKRESARLRRAERKRISEKKKRLKNPKK